MGVVRGGMVKVGMVVGWAGKGRIWCWCLRLDKCAVLTVGNT